MKIAVCQIDVGDDPQENLERVRSAVRQAEGADVAVFPEATQVRFGPLVSEVAEPLDGAFVTQLCAVAKSRGIALIAGVFETSDDKRVYNTAVIIDSNGVLTGSYRKMHLFDAFHYHESTYVRPGDHPVVVPLAGARIGIATCYDLRFPELFRELVDAGAELFVVIAAWAPGPMKEEQWETLVRARAIENTMWTVAVGKAFETQLKQHENRTGVGRSLVVHPLGVTRRAFGSESAVELVDIDLSETERVRAIVPSLSHRRLR